MLTTEENERLTQIGPGTPCGELMRRYWHPIAATSMLDDNPVRPVRILGEDLTLYRDRSGTIGLVAQRCPHRAFDLRFGIPENEGLRCPYHGWMFNQTGHCIEQPLEPADSTYKERVTIRSYPVQDMGGLIWAYLGPAPVPFIPQDDLFVREDGFRQIFGHMLPCNWLQVMENRGDPSHAIYLHGRQAQYIAERQGRTDWRFRDGGGAALVKPHLDLMARGAYPVNRYIPNVYGYSKTTRPSDVLEERAGPEWESGRNPVLFPYQLYLTSQTGNGRPVIRRVYQMGIPIDDRTTWHIYYICYTFPPEVQAPKQARARYIEVPMKNESGEYMLDYITGQDAVGWWSQGEITDRTQEHLGTSDTVLIEYRKLVEQQIRIVQTGGEPINVFRSPQDAHRRDLNLPCVQALDTNYGNGRRPPQIANPWPAQAIGDIDRFSPDCEVLAELYQRTSELWVDQQEGVA